MPSFKDMKDCVWRFIHMPNGAIATIADLQRIVAKNGPVILWRASRYHGQIEEPVCFSGELQRSSSNWFCVAQRLSRRFREDSLDVTFSLEDNNLVKNQIRRNDWFAFIDEVAAHEWAYNVKITPIQFSL